MGHPLPTEDSLHFHCGPIVPRASLRTRQQTAGTEHLNTQPHLPHTCLVLVLTASLYSYLLTGDGLGWAVVGARDRSGSTNLCPEKRWKREEERSGHISQSLITQAAGEGEPELAVRGASLQLVLATKTELLPASRVIPSQPPRKE